MKGNFLPAASASTSASTSKPPNNKMKKFKNLSKSNSVQPSELNIPGSKKGKGKKEKKKTNYEEERKKTKKRKKEKEKKEKKKKDQISVFKLVSKIIYPYKISKLQISKLLCSVWFRHPVGHSALMPRSLFSYRLWNSCSFDDRQVC